MRAASGLIFGDCGSGTVAYVNSVMMMGVIGNDSAFFRARLAYPVELERMFLYGGEGFGTPQHRRSERFHLAPIHVLDLPAMRADKMMVPGTVGELIMCVVMPEVHLPDDIFRLERFDGPVYGGLIDRAADAFHNLPHRKWVRMVLKVCKDCNPRPGGLVAALPQHRREGNFVFSCVQCHPAIVFSMQIICK